VSGKKSQIINALEFGNRYASRNSINDDLDMFSRATDEPPPEEECESSAKALVLETCVTEAAPVLSYLRLKDIASFQFASQACYQFCHVPQSKKLVVPTFKFSYSYVANRILERVELPMVDGLYADNMNIRGYDQHMEFFVNVLQACSSLTALYCAYNPHMDVDFLDRALRLLPQIRVLDLSHSQIAYTGEGHFRKQKSLESFFRALPTRLRFLDLSYNLLSDEHAYKLVTALEASAEANGEAFLEELLLRSNYLGNGAGMVFGQFMQSLAGSKLWRLDMRTNRVESEGACSMLEALQVHPRMREIRIGYNRQNNKEDLQTANLASVLLQKALSEKSQNLLETLDLNNVRVGDVGARRLSVALAKNTRLRRLDLAFNSIGPDGAESIAKALESNYVLLELDLRDNELGDEGAQAMSKGLMENTSLSRLQIARNGIGHIGALALLRAVRENEGLQVEFGASGDGSMRLQGMLSRNPSMADLRTMRDAERAEEAAGGQQEHTTLMFGPGM